MKAKFVYLLLLLVPVVTLAAEQTPVEVIRTATERVLNELRLEPERRKDPEQLRMVIERHVAPHMDFVTLSRLTLGKNWRRATVAQRERFVREYGRLLVKVYSTALAGYSNQKVEYLSSKVNVDQRRATVRTRIVEPGQAPLAVDYGLRKIDGNWKIYDVRIEGISLVMNYRASFSEEISAHGFDGLIERLVLRNTSRRG
ncbi:MAG TPA: ABC transporter substrate-binding protein [Gammaproteobacteria bacterium]|nr:ABC transporter substrate-binding protein [Gammaproteobacteria bacterium]